ncbi:MAG: polysaccharide pyruvyl transferase family protein [Flavobacteriales bacterium]|nr:polysaccharide pyruvyl transferase family protein [Flavobacteriales bacterium]
MKIVLYYHGGSKNRGCEAIVRSAIPIIKKEIPNARIILASLDAPSDQHIPDLDAIIDVSRVNIKKYSLDWFINVFNVKVLKSDNFAHQKQNQKLVDLIAQNDAFLSIGGDNYCYGEQPWLYEINRCIKKANKKLVLWGASIGEEDLSPDKVADLKNYDLILARETLTYEVLASKGLTNIRLCADGAFTMSKDELPLPQGWQDGNTLGFNYSPLVFKMNESSKNAAFDLIQHIIDTTDMTIALTPHVMIKGNDDSEVLAEFEAKFKATNRIVMIPNNLNAIQYKGYIARMRFFIGARTHATIAAYSNCVPTMVLGYSIKSKGIAKDLFGEEKLVLGITEISDATKLINKFEELKSEELQIKEILKNRIPEIQKMSYKAGEYLAQL